MASPESLPESPPAAQRPPTGLSFGDGFQFGCGFFMAGMIVTVILALALSLLALALSATGFSLLNNLLG